MNRRRQKLRFLWEFRRSGRLGFWARRFCFALPEVLLGRELAGLRLLRLFGNRGGLGTRLGRGLLWLKLLRLLFS